MTKHIMLNEEDILQELNHYHKFQEAFKKGKRGSELPKLPGNKDEQKNTNYLLLGILIHPILFILVIISTLLRLHKFFKLFSKIRIATDKYSHEPLFCGYNKAYSNLGISLLIENDIDGAIQSLDSSWRGHPCPHNTFGLDRRLVSKLRHLPDAKEAVEVYLRIVKKFSYCPNKWIEQILGHNQSLASDA